MRRFLFLLLAVVLVFPPVISRAEMTLLMAEEDGCMWCARWDEEISETYPKTPEGKIAPLRRVDIRHSAPADIALERPLLFSPTFVLLENGQEVGRIEGYPGEDFFWGLLGALLLDRGISIETSG
ncbi:hypothetical protein [Leisingera sp. JC11]|uniref:hypothetical protein n=1 Tax=Leisingera sp. JC11 TaxID=3042469 RepID=UPI003455BECF